jgi:hypothetical protein
VDRYGNHVFSSFSYVGARLFRYFVEKNEFQEITRARNTFLYFDYESCFAMVKPLMGVTSLLPLEPGYPTVSLVRRALILMGLLLKTTCLF